MKTKTLLLIALWSPSLLLAQASPPSSVPLSTSVVDIPKNVTVQKY